MSKVEDIEKLQRAIDNPNTPDPLKATLKKKLEELEKKPDVKPKPAKKPTATKPSDKKYDIIFTSAGGVTVASNRLDMSGGDYKTIAHLSDPIKYFEENLPAKVITKIENFAKIDKSPAPSTKKPKAKFKNGDFIGYPDAKEFGEILKSNWNSTFEEYHYLVYFSDGSKITITDSDNPIQKPKKVVQKDEDYDCDELIEEAKVASKKRKKYQDKQKNKRESTKNKQRLEKTSDLIAESIEIRVEKGKDLSKSEVEALISKTKKLLSILQKTLKSL